MLIKSNAKERLNLYCFSSYHVNCELNLYAVMCTEISDSDASMVCTTKLLLT